MLGAGRSTSRDVIRRLGGTNEQSAMVQPRSPNLKPNVDTSVIRSSFRGAGETSSSAEIDQFRSLRDRSVTRGEDRGVRRG